MNINEWIIEVLRLFASKRQWRLENVWSEEDKQYYLEWVNGNFDTGEEPWLSPAALLKYIEQHHIKFIGKVEIKTIDSRHPRQIEENK